jgi:AraC-like DNA-binding protein
LQRDPGPLPAGYLLRLKLYLALFLITLLLSLVARVSGVFYSSGLGSTMGALLGIALGIDWLIVQTGSHPRYMELQRTRVPGQDDARVAARIREHFETERPYLNPEYRLTDLAHELELSITVLSRSISASDLGRNFNDLMNRYRVEEVQRRLARPEFAEHTLLRIALDCGFNSKSSFNRIFRELTGESPSRFRRDRTEKGT